MSDPSAKTQSALTQLPVGRHQGFEFFRQMVRDAAKVASDERWREWWLVDTSFEDWPLGEADLVALLHDWSKTGGRLVLMAQNYQAFTLTKPRFVRWRQMWDHRVDSRLVNLDKGEVLPCVMWSPGWMMQRVDRSRCLVVGTQDAQQRQLMRQSLDELYRRSRSGFPSTTLGL